MSYFWTALACVIVGFGLGYGFRGWFSRTLRQTGNKLGVK
jgi:hypothetical protein